MEARRYRPSNGTSGLAFIEHWCGNCARDLCANGMKQFDDCDEEELCGIVAKTFAFDVDDSEYPSEWCYGDDGPCCTAFVPIGQPVPQSRCTRTADMFGNIQEEH